MLKRFMNISLLLAVLSAFTIQAFAAEAQAPVPEKQEAVKAVAVTGKIEALDKKEKKVTIEGTVYTLGPRAARTKAAVGDVVKATIEKGVVKSITREPAQTKNKHDEK